MIYIAAENHASFGIGRYTHTVPGIYGLVHFRAIDIDNDERRLEREREREVCSKHSIDFCFVFLCSVS